jgi:hypothetical protein
MALREVEEKASFRAISLNKIAKALGVPVTDLIEDVPEE